MNRTSAGNRFWHWLGFAPITLTLVALAAAQTEPPPRIDSDKQDATAPAASADAGGNAGYTLQRAPAQQVHAELTKTLDLPRLAASEWVVYAPELPVLSGQTGVSSTLSPDGEAARELSPQHRGVLRARISAEATEQPQKLEIRVKYQATLWARRLVRIRKGQGRGELPPELTAEEKTAALASGGVFDFSSEGFQSWLKEQSLDQAPDEGEIDYARRVFLAIKKGFTYAFEPRMDRQASHVCRAGKSDCGGLAIVFVSALRARGIPARLLVGRWALSGGKQPDGSVYDQFHAKAEFYAQGVGWVPADLSSAVLHDRSPEGLTYFGNDRGDFLAFHVDPRLVCDTMLFGTRPVEWMQSPMYWSRTSGFVDRSLARETWTVESRAAPELVEAALKKADTDAGTSTAKAKSKAKAKPKTRRGRAMPRPPL